MRGSRATHESCQSRAVTSASINSNAEFNVHPVNKSISYIFKCQDDAKYDLIYSAGLFDYLQAKMASGLLGCLLRLLAPTCRLILGNYAPENYGRGYMEGMMAGRCFTGVRRS